MKQIIIYCGQKAKIACNEKCHKAWGINNRPTIQLNEKDPDDFAYLADDELEDAPGNPGTYEGGHGKPDEAGEKPNKWCVRECERCGMTEKGEFEKELILPDFTKRVYNKPWKHE